MAIIIVIAMELFVMNVKNAPYMRRVAWVRLVRNWAVLRIDDTLGIVPAKLGLREDGLAGRLERSKTTGPGKRVGVLPFIVSEEASLSGAPWLRTGFDLFRPEPFRFKRNYLMGMPTGDVQGMMPNTLSIA